MSTFERIIHAILFEVIALIIFILLAIIVTSTRASSMTGLAIVLSLIAMGWNFFYNILFDKIYGQARLDRTIKMRIGHGLGFELGMVLLSFPVIMFVLQRDFITVLMLDIGAVVFFLIYAVVFNWSYDILKSSFFQKKSIKNSD